MNTPEPSQERETKRTLYDQEPKELIIFLTGLRQHRIWLEKELDKVNMDVQALELHLHQRLEENVAEAIEQKEQEASNGKGS